MDGTKSQKPQKSKATEATKGKSHHFHTSLNVFALPCLHPLSCGAVTVRPSCTGEELRPSGMIPTTDPRSSSGCAFPHGCKNHCSRTCVGINVRGAWLLAALAAVCKTFVAFLRKQSKLALFAPEGEHFAHKRFRVQKTDSKTGAKLSGHNFKLRLNEWPPFLGSVSGPQKRGPFCRQNFGHRGKNSIVSAGATEVFHAAAFPWFCSAAGTCSPHRANIHGQSLFLIL